MSRAQQVDVLLAGIYDNVGNPLSGGKIYTYYAGTTTPLAIYSAADKSAYATNPVILDANGRAKVWAEGTYKFVVKTPADVSVDTFDNLVYGVADENSIWGGNSTGSSSAYVLSPIPAMTEYKNGRNTSFIANHTNVGASTLNISGIGVLAIKTGTGSALSGGEIVAGNVITVVYDSTAGYFILNTSNSFSSLSVSGAATCGSVVSPILQSTGAIAVKPSGVEKWDFAAGGTFQPTTDNNVDFGTASYRTKKGYFVALESSSLLSASATTLSFGSGTASWNIVGSTAHLSPVSDNVSNLGGAAARVSTGHFVYLSAARLSAASGDLTLRGGSGAGVVIGIGSSDHLYVSSGGDFYPGTDNTYNLGYGSYRFATGYFVTTYSNTIRSYDGQGFYFGSGASAQWRIGTDSTLYPVDTGHTMDIGGDSHRIQDLYYYGKLNNGKSYTTGTYTALRSMTHPSAGFLNSNYTTAKSDIETHIINLYRLVATLTDDTVR